MIRRQMGCALCKYGRSTGNIENGYQSKKKQKKSKSLEQIDENLSEDLDANLKEEKISGNDILEPDESKNAREE